MSRYFILFAVVGLLCACDHDDDGLSTTSSCLPALTLDDAIMLCPTAEEIEQDSLYCEYELFDPQFLTEVSKSYMKQYCLDDSDELKYVSSSGDEIDFLLDQKFHSFRSRGSYNPLGCDENSDAISGYCHEYESVEVQLYSAQLQLTLQIILDVIIWTDNGIPTFITDELQITPTGPADTTLNSCWITTDQRDSSIDETRLGQETFEEIELNGEVFLDVITINPEINPNVSGVVIEQYYFNPDHGLLGFRLVNGDLYTQL